MYKELKKQAEDKKRTENISVPPSLKNDKNLEKKLDELSKFLTHEENFGFDENIVKNSWNKKPTSNEEALQIASLRKALSKSVRKQNLGEGVLADILSSELVGFSVEKLSPDAYRITVKNDVCEIQDAEIDEAAPGTKSVDFKVGWENLIFWVMHKDTVGTGGAQDNVFKEIVATIDALQKFKSANEFFVIACDGDYHENKVEDYHNRNKNPNVFVGNTEQALGFLKEKAK